jgi:two-component system sensor histidine kinase RegB
MADLQLIRSQVVRCREILYQIAADAGEPMGEARDTLTIGELVAKVRSSLDEQRQERLLIDCTASEVTVTVPRRSVIRVLRGLVSNAFHASDSIAEVKLQAKVAHDTLHFEVTDQGHGMDSVTALRALEPFFTTKPAGQGLGLGLYLAGILAERLGGGLTIDSAPGAGTKVCFWITAL